MSELRELYQELILDHSKNPRNLREIAGARHADGNNPLCGDKATIYVKLKGDLIEDVSFVGRGCSISTASASMMTEALKGRTTAEAEALFERFHDLVTGDPSKPHRDAQGLGKLAVFAGVCEFPVRVKCAALAWHTLRAALKDESAPVSTE
ncbi:MAG TPA: SUF system NifU family Fe-S cluster assembly protein [Vicinamibacteria bacterium]|nr:SUF system NifU family Fe-S cluster assembly protein [Vicinamibacteria bacterium]